MIRSAIRTLRANVTQQEALHMFTSSGLRSFYWRMRSGPLLRMADAYVPYGFYRVRYAMGGASRIVPRGSVTHERVFAMDIVDGSLDLFEFATLPDQSRMVNLETRNHLEAVLDSTRAESLLREKILRVMFHRGFFRLRANIQLELTRLAQEIHMPYWLGFYGDGTFLSCRALDAVRRRLEGAKATAFFEHWLAA
jgi:hypothetical protein